MCHSRTCNNKINRLHERCLRLIFNDRVSPFCELLVKDESVSIHQKNLRTLVIEIYKVLKELSPSIFSNIFNTSNCNRYELRNQCEFVVPRFMKKEFGDKVFFNFKLQGQQTSDLIYAINHKKPITSQI